MAEAYRFRTAVGGFHKGDVSAYITKAAGEHRAEVAELQQELTQLQAENEELRKKLSQAEAELELHTLTETQVEAEDRPETPDFPNHITDLELGAYRRAEAAERLAHERARQLYRDMQHIYEGSAAQLRAVSDAAGTALGSIQQAAKSVEDALAGARDTAKTAQETLTNMGALIPDPAEGLEGTK